MKFKITTKTDNIKDPNFKEIGFFHIGNLPYKSVVFENNGTYINAYGQVLDKEVE